MENVSTVAQFLPLWVQIVLIVLALGFGITAGIQALRARDRDKWRDLAQRAELAIGVAEAECSIHRERSERLSDENRKLISDNAGLAARTDLQPIAQSIAVLAQGITDLISNQSGWITEGRDRFTKASERLDNIHREQTDAMAAHTRTMVEVQQTLKAMSAHLNGKPA